MRIGYGCVSTTDQNPAAQQDALAVAGCEQIFLGKASGKLDRRPELDKALLIANRPDDRLAVTKLHRHPCTSHGFGGRGGTRHPSRPAQ